MAVVAFGTSASAQNVVIIGAGGATSCGKWIESRGDLSTHFQYKQWILGFISGSNWNGVGPQAKPIDPEAVVAFVDRYCSSNPLDLLALAASAAVQESGGANAKHQWKR